MDSTQKSWALAILRAAVVSGSVILAGVALYHSLIFVPTAKVSQFFMSGITVGVAYGAFKPGNVRNGFAALFVWLVVRTVLLPDIHFWAVIMGLAYIGGIAIAIYMYTEIGQREIIHAPVLRILLAGGFVAVANGLIVMVLGLLSLEAVVMQLGRFTVLLYQNCQVGALIGLATGVGIELAEFLVRYLSIEDKQQLVD